MIIVLVLASFRLLACWVLKSPVVYLLYRLPLAMLRIFLRKVLFLLMEDTLFQFHVAKSICLLGFAYTQTLK